jgi:NAD(P)-dependent dehydrogenase (short-subunit alcohol dehydrogenase family)
MNFFMEVAKFRAARLLWAKLMREIGQEQKPNDLQRCSTIKASVNSRAEHPRASVACGAADPLSVELAFAAIHEEFGPVDALIYNAGSGVGQHRRGRR